VNSTVKTIMFWAFILICLMLLYGVVSKSSSMGGKDSEIKYSELFDKVQNHQVLDAAIQGNELHGHLASNPKEQFHTTIPANYQDLEKAMLDAKVNLEIKEPQNNMLLPILFNVVRQEPRAPALHAAEEDHLQGRGWRG
jgi:cell division protease FtsH